MEDDDETQTRLPSVSLHVAHEVLMDYCDGRAQLLSVPHTPILGLTFSWESVSPD